MNGPTIVPCRVMHASTAAALLLIRFITLSSWPTMSSAYSSQSVLGLDEERRLAGVAVRRLHDQVVAETCSAASAVSSA